MGLLDSFNTDEARLGLGLLAAGGYSPTPMSFGQRVQMAMQGQDAYKQQGQKSKLLDMQMKNYESEIEARKLAGIKEANKQGLLSDMFGSGGPSAPMVSPGAFSPSVDGMGPTMPPQMVAQSRPGSRLGGMSGDDIARVKIGAGVDLTDIWKFMQEPQKYEQGATYKDRNTGAERFMPKVGEGIAADPHGFYNPLPGYAAAQGQIEGAKTAGVEAAKAGFDLVPTVQADGSTKYEKRSTILGTPAPAPNRGEAGMRADAQGNMGADPAAIQREIRAVQNDLMKPLDAGSKAQLQAHLADLQSQAKATPMQTAQAGYQATPSTAQKLAAEAGGKINETWLKTSYEPVIAGMGATDDMLSSVRVARNAITQMGGTGWGTETKAVAANVLAGLGISVGNSKMLATNSQVFQNAAMERLQATLNLAKGIQTEGDADRAAKTFAQLKNTPQANEFILDMAESKAQRDKMKATFYQQALPLARQKGDLQEVDREWAKRAPSIFTLPAMAKWGVK